MSKKIRVLVVDDAVVIRRLLSDVLAEDPDIEVVGTAANGHIALQKVAQVNPDAITLDVEMPGMDGLETLKALRRTYPRLPVIMFSTLTERGAEATLDALSLGASDYVTKPANVGSVNAAVARVRGELVPKLRALCAPARGPVGAVLTPRAATRSLTAPRRPEGRRVEVVAIGVSTGGPNALAAILPALPPNLPAPIVIVQHMPPLFTRFLAERLDAQSAIEVKEAIAGEVLRPGVAYIAPGDHHLLVVRRNSSMTTALSQEPPENSCRPAVDVLFRSVARLFGPAALGLVLTGMGQDGLRGCEDIKAAGGAVVAQDESTSVVWGMPGFVARAGLADRVVALSDVAPEIITRCFSIAAPGGADARVTWR